LELNLTTFPDLLTERLILRQLKIEDSDEIMFLRTDERVNKFLDREKATTIEDAINFIKEIERGVSNKKQFYWAITIKGNNTLIGTISLFNLDIQKETAEIGYELNPDFQGKGIMQEAISTIIRYALDTLKIQTLTAFPSVNNEKSIQLLKRNNFKPDTGFNNSMQEESNNMVRYYLNNLDAGK
jgi:ribosomal-protein-alanine N-acetyltransferase